MAYAYAMNAPCTNGEWTVSVWTVGEDDGRGARRRFIRVGTIEGLGGARKRRGGRGTHQDGDLRETHVARGSVARSCDATRGHLRACGARVTPRVETRRPTRVVGKRRFFSQVSSLFFWFRQKVALRDRSLDHPPHARARFSTLRRLGHENVRLLRHGGNVHARVRPLRQLHDDGRVFVRVVKREVFIFHFFPSVLALRRDVHAELRERPLLEQPPPSRRLADRL